MSDADQRHSAAAADPLSRQTPIHDLVLAVIDEPCGNIEGWWRTTAGIVAMLLSTQLITGVLLALYYTPSVDTAQPSVSFIEKVASSGSWIRSVHHFGSQWLTFFLVLHILQLMSRETYLRRPIGWLASLGLLALALCEGASGYSLPWDVRAFFATRITESLAAGLPLVGQTLRRWMLGGIQISPITLVRFFAMHVIILPASLCAIFISRLFIFRGPVGNFEKINSVAWKAWVRKQFARQSASAGLVFLCLALYALRYHAPLGPPADAADAGYLPRPGPQFLWLFELLKLLPGSIASLAATAIPALVIFGLALLPFSSKVSILEAHRLRKLSFVAFILVLASVAALTAAAYRQDATDPVVRDQLARQTQAEADVRAQPFLPVRIGAAADTGNANASPSSSPQVGASPASNQAAPGDPPAAYISNCSQCHGFRGEGTALFPKLIGVSSKPRRTPDDLVKLLDDPVSYGLKPPMKSFSDKLTDQEKHDIADWVSNLKKRK